MFDFDNISTLNYLEVTVYNYVSTHLQEIPSMTIRELAKATNVSSTTILRFCGKMGCEGFSEFKYELKRYISRMERVGNIPDASLMRDFFDRAGSEEFLYSIRRAANLILERPRAIYIGMGSSGMLAKYGARYLSNLGRQAFYIDDDFYPTDRGSYEDATIIALSVSGEQRYLFRQIDGFKRGGGTIVSITNTHQCTLAEVSDHNIAYYMPASVLPGLYNVTPQVPVVFILESIAHEVVKQVHGEGPTLPPSPALS